MAVSSASLHLSLLLQHFRNFSEMIYIIIKYSFHQIHRYIKYKGETNIDGLIPHSL